MFSRYAPQIWPSEASSAFIALHEGLDILDYDKFPLVEGERENSRDVDRAQRICELRNNTGCRLDDLEHVTTSQVGQRRSQTGYNDVGYDIWRTNYNRWIYQILEDETTEVYFIFFLSEY